MLIVNTVIMWKSFMDGDDGEAATSVLLTFYHHFFIITANAEAITCSITLDVKVKLYVDDKVRWNFVLGVLHVSV